jgi:hypothetical protein
MPAASVFSLHLLVNPADIRIHGVSKRIGKGKNGKG